MNSVISCNVTYRIRWVDLNNVSAAYLGLDETIEGIETYLDADGRVPVEEICEAVILRGKRAGIDVHRYRPIVEYAIQFD